LSFADKSIDFNDLVIETERMSQAELVAAAVDAIKNAILADKEKISQEELIFSIRERNIFF